MKNFFGGWHDPVLDQRGSSRTSSDGQDLYPTLTAKAAALAFSLINHHAFVDGNKRVGFAAMAVFLELNGHQLVCSADEGEATVLAVASGTLNREGFIGWIDSKVVTGTW